MVTIGLPVYHAEKWVGEAIESILGQTYGDWELIVTIDEEKSNDRTLEIITNYRLQITDERIRIIADGEHRGISARINQQVAMARGEYFARMDADDVMLPERLALQVRYLQEHPEVDVVSSSAIIIDELSEELGVRSEGIIHPTVMGRTEWFREHPYRSECDGCEDWDLWLRTKDNSTFGFIDTPLIYYRQSEKFDKKKYLQRRRQGRATIRMNKDILPWWRYYWLLGDSYLKSVVRSIFSLRGAD